MTPPTKERLCRTREMEQQPSSGEDASPGLIRFCAGSHHPKPRFYKHYWWVFTKDSPAEGDEFLWNDEYRLTGYEAHQRLDQCETEGKAAFIYLSRHPRRGEETPFNPDAERWKDVEWAPPYDEDPDPTYGERDWKQKRLGRGEHSPTSLRYTSAILLLQ